MVMWLDGQVETDSAFEDSTDSSNMTGSLSVKTSGKKVGRSRPEQTQRHSVNRG